MNSTPLVDPSIANGQNAEAELRARQRAIDNSRRNLNAGSVKDKETKLRESCEGFEAMFIQKMWEGMRATLPKDGLMQSRDEKHWQSMYDQELGKSMAKSGGIGLADMMVSQLSRNLQNATEVAAGSSARRPMDIAPVPLLPQGVAADTKPAGPRQAAMAPIVAPAATANGAQGSATPQANGQQVAAKSPLTDIYGGPAETPEAPLPPDGQAVASNTAATSATSTVSAQPPSPPEVQAALANLAAQAAEARSMGTKAAQQHNAMTAAAFNNLPPDSAVASLGSVGTKSATVPGVAFAAAGRNAAATVDEIPPSTLRPRVSPRANPISDQPLRGRSRRLHNQGNADAQAADSAAMLTAPNPAVQRAVSESPYGPNFASSSTIPSAGQNMPPSSLADAAADLMKSQVQPTVKTKL